MKQVISSVLDWIEENVIGIVLVCLLFIAFVFLNSTTPEPKTKISHTNEVENEMYVLKYYAAKKNLVLAVDSYITSVAPNSAVNGIAIVDACIEHNVDIKFVLAQAHVESHFGTAGVAAKTNSIFNVKAYDGRSANDMIEKGHGYKHPDNSIVPYLELLKSRYLVNGKTEKDLLINYVDKDGQRYASSKTYEQMLVKTIDKMDSIVNITQYYQVFRKYQIIAEL